MDWDLATQWQHELVRSRYVYNFTWLGRPIIQEPQDVLILQDLIWSIKPDLIVETGIAHGGSLIFYASIMAMLDIENPGIKRRVVGIDIDIREHNRQEIVRHPLFKYIRMYQGDSTDPVIINSVREITKHHSTVLVCLDSNHTHQHVRNELEAYAPLVSVGSYCVVFDTGIEYLPDELCFGRPWGKGNNPMTAVHDFLKCDTRFVSDKDIEKKVLIPSNPDGWLKRVK